MEREEPVPHGRIGWSTAYRLTAAVPRRRLHPGAAIGLHVIDHDEIYHVLSGQGEVSADGASARLAAGMMACLYAGEDVGIRQRGTAPLDPVIAWPLAEQSGDCKPPHLYDKNGKYV